MSYSVKETRRRLPLYYLALLPVAALILLYPQRALLTDLRGWYLAPLWILLVLCATALFVVEWFTYHKRITV